MGLFRKKQTSSSVASSRIKLVLTYDRAGTTANAELMRLLKRDLIKVISEYIEIDDDELFFDIKTSQSDSDLVTSELVANIPIKGIKKLPKNRW